MCYCLALLPLSALLLPPQVEACQNYPPVNQHAQDAIRRQVQAIISRLPPDLQASLKVHHFVPFPAPS